MSIPAGHALTHSWQFAQYAFSSLAYAPGPVRSSGALVLIAINLSHGPKRGLITRVFLPWFPRPAAMARCFRLGLPLWG